jgi:hypothetical protein
MHANGAHRLISRVAELIPIICHSLSFLTCVAKHASAPHDTTINHAAKVLGIRAPTIINDTKHGEHNHIDLETYTPPVRWQPKLEAWLANRGG